MTTELKDFSGNTEFLFVGSCLRNINSAGSSAFFSSAGNAQELYCHMDAGYDPVHHVFGNIAYAMGLGGGLAGAFKSMGRGEVKEYSDIFNSTRHAALNRIVAQAKACKANAVVGIRTFFMYPRGTVRTKSTTGTATRNNALPSSAINEPVTLI